jgi:hypothetical protein
MFMSACAQQQQSGYVALKRRHQAALHKSPVKERAGSNMQLCTDPGHAGIEDIKIPPTMVTKDHTDNRADATASVSTMLGL